MFKKEFFLLHQSVNKHHKYTGEDETEARQIETSAEVIGPVHQPACNTEETCDQSPVTQRYTDTRAV